MIMCNCVALDLPKSEKKTQEATEEPTGLCREQAHFPEPGGMMHKTPKGAEVHVDFI